MFSVRFYKIMIASRGMTHLPHCTEPPKHLLTSKEGDQRLETHKTRLDKCIRGGWDAYTVQYGHRHHVLCPRSRASIVFDEIVNLALSEFSEVPGVFPKRQNNSFLLYIGDDIVLRFKKVDKDGRCRSIPTRQQNLFELQTSLPGMSKGTMLHAGYMLDELQQNLMGTAVVCQFKKQVLWAINLSEGEDTKVQPMVVSPTPQSPKPSRFESKLGTEKKTKNKKTGKE